MLSLLDIRRRIDSGEMSVPTVLRDSLDRIQAENGVLKAFTAVATGTPDGTGPLAGVAVGVKDIIDTADLPTEMGCPAIYGGWQPRADAAVVSMLRGAGAHVIGKTATTAFAFMDPAPTLNPLRPDRTPGGSSSGSAAAVAAGLVPLALGTQTGGSVIRPASFCGVAAIKASFRLLPTVGVKASAWTLDTLGLFAGTVADAALALEAVSGRPSRVDGRDWGAPRLGILRQSYAGPPEAAGEAVFERFLVLARRAGIDLVDVPEPAALAEAYAAHGTIQDFEMRHAMGWEWAERRTVLPPRIAAALEAAQAVGAGDYDMARGKARRARNACKELFDGVDALVTLSAPGAAPDRDTTGDPRFNRLLTLLGVPCVNVPGLLADDGMPVGIQVVAPFGRDQRALAAASVLEGIIRAAS
jgi:Asp-tRNA(Asn)/Glu-tRNA(Gln) amidotransferase A subunit family amidase